MLHIKNTSTKGEIQMSSLKHDIIVSTQSPTLTDYVSEIATDLGTPVTFCPQNSTEMYEAVSLSVDGILVYDARYDEPYAHVERYNNIMKMHWMRCIYIGECPSDTYDSDKIVVLSPDCSYEQLQQALMKLLYDSDVEVARKLNKKSEIDYCTELLIDRLGINECFDGRKYLYLAVCEAVQNPELLESNDLLFHIISAQVKVRQGRIETYIYFAVLVALLGPKREFCRYAFPGFERIANWKRLTLGFIVRLSRSVRSALGLQ